MTSSVAEKATFVAETIAERKNTPRKVRVSDADKSRFERMFGGTVSARDARTVYDRLTNDDDRLKLYRFLVVNCLIAPKDLGSSICDSVDRIDKRHLHRCEIDAGKRKLHFQRKAQQ